MTMRGMAAIRDIVSRLGRAVMRRSVKGAALSEPSLALAMKVVIDLFGDRLADAGHGFEVGEAGRRDPLRRAEMEQQGALALAADARDLVQRRAGDVGGAPGPVGPDGEAMGLVAQALQVVEDGVAGLQAEGLAPRLEEALPPGIPVRALGDPAERHVIDAEI